MQPWRAALFGSRCMTSALGELYQLDYAQEVSVASPPELNPVWGPENPAVKQKSREAPTSRADFREPPKR